MASNTTRVQLELPPASYERLNALKLKTEATTYAEVLRNALRLYEAVIEQYEAGRKLYVKNPDGTLIEYAVFV